jgi:phosphopantetheine adenylyltransferase
MITPLQQTAGIAVSDLMRSMVESMEERQREEQEKANGTKKDEAVKTQPQPDQSHRAANEKISAYLFGAMKPDANAFASLVSRFSSALGITQEHDESNISFAQRLQDALTLTGGFEKTDAAGKATTISLKSFGVSEAQVVEVLNGGVTTKTDPMAALAARIAKSAGLTGKEEDFGAQISSAITAARATTPKSVNDLEESTGLKELGISAQQMIAAIANPYGDAARAVKGALDEQAQGTRFMTRETMKVIQRLEDVADPKTKEELQAERGENRMGEINDAEVAAEREEDIQTREAQGKLEDVQKLQDVVKEHIDASADEKAQGAEGQDGPVDISSEIALISVLAAAPEAAPAENDNEPVKTDATATTEADAKDDAEKLLDALAVVDTARDAILPISIDDNGLYALLKKKAA